MLNESREDALGRPFVYVTCHNIRLAALSERRWRNNRLVTQPIGRLFMTNAGSGSGKTSIASLIAARLEGRNVVSISSDNYYITIAPGTNVEDYNFDHPAGAFACVNVPCTAVLPGLR